MDSNNMSFAHFWKSASALLVLLYHVRYLLLIDYGHVNGPTRLLSGFYFISGLGHESFVVFFVASGLLFSRQVMAVRRHGDPPPAARFGAAIVKLYILQLTALMLGATFDTIGAHYFNGAGIYTQYPAFSLLTLSPRAFAGNLVMAQPFFVPTFGSNGMLYLLSYLWWSHWLLFGCRKFYRWRRPAGACLCVAICLATLVLKRGEFALWLLIFCLGVAIPRLATVRGYALPVPVGAAIFLAGLGWSRLIGSRSDLLPAPFGGALPLWKYLIVGLGFAAMAIAVYQRGVRAPPAAPSVRARCNAQLAAFSSTTLFLHFPPMMLLCAIATDLFRQAPMRQPTATALLCYALTVVLLYAICFLLWRYVVRSIRARILSWRLHHAREIAPPRPDRRQTRRSA
jgi:hypothetical protein